MSDVSPDDLTARLRAVADFLAEDSFQTLAMDVEDGMDRIDALSADVARLTAEVKQAGDLAAYRNDVAVAAGRKADEARARVAERDATIERLRRAVQEHRNRVRASDDRYTRAICVDLWRSVLADTAPTPETHND